MNCRPGDTAIILPGALPENVGHFCTVIRAYGIDRQEGNVWWVRGAQPLRTTTGRLSPEGWIADKFLHPIRPPKPGTSTNTQQPKPEVTKA